MSPSATSGRLLVDGKLRPGLPPAEPFPIPVHSGDIRVDVQAALAMLAPSGAAARCWTSATTQARERSRPRRRSWRCRYVAQSARGVGHPDGAAEPRSTRRTTIIERFMTRWRGEPDPQHVKAVDAYWTSAAEHGMNASTFTARVIASTGAGRGRGALRRASAPCPGPLHGGAPARVLRHDREVERTGDAAALRQGHRSTGASG